MTAAVGAERGAMDPAVVALELGQLAAVLRHRLPLIDHALGEDDLLGRQFRLATELHAALLGGDAPSTGAVAVRR